MAIIVLGVTGGIAAYKAADLTSRLKKAGHAVHVIMTHNAEHFISALTFETLSGNPVTTDTFLRDRPWEVEHVALAKAAELLLVAPATANIIGKFAHGIADDMLSTTYLATTAPVLLAPAMNDHMYQNEAVQANLDLLRQRGVHTVGPESGLLACGDEAIGRMSEPVDIAAAVEALLKGAQTLAGKTVLVTAGPTREALDPVRYLTNRSSGRMGYALAAEAARRGAQVWLVSGPVRLSAPAGVKLVSVTSAAEMLDACTSLFPECDAAIMAAAPADFRATQVATQKIKKTGGGALELTLEQTTDIAAELGRAKQAGQVLVCFAAETQDLLPNAWAKLARKNADLMVANDVSEAGSGFEVDTNRVTLLSAVAEEALPQMSKAEVAGAILDRMEKLL